jgi:protein-tyrosine phosphatase
VSGYVDIHAHILPGIDDGPSDIDSALAMARAAVDAGIATIVATPHLRPDFPDVRVHELCQRCAELRAEIEREQIPIELVVGAETSIGWALEANAEELRLASVRQQARDLLLETPFSQVIGLERLLYELQTRGYRLTLAHPERNADLRRDDAMLRQLVNQGVLLQLNAGSLSESSGSSVRRFARHLCAEDLAHVIASDGHRGERWRPVGALARGVSAAAELVGIERAEWMARDAPLAIIEGRELPAPPAIAPAAKGWRRFGRR